MASFLQISPSTVKRALRSLAPPKLSLSQGKAIVQMDTTYWGRNFGVVIFMDSLTGRVLHYRFINGRETLEDYKAGLSHIIANGIEVIAVVSDGFPEIKTLYPSIIHQRCQFHQLMRIRQLLTMRPKLLASQELRQIALAMGQSDRERFEKELKSWKEKWKDFLKEKTYSEEGNWHYTHRNLRAAYHSLKGNIEGLFAYELAPDWPIPKTNNRLEALNAVLKRKLGAHRGISPQRKVDLIAAILAAYSPSKNRKSQTS